ncbi:MAG: hypothetical protein EXR75_13305 [Myxococcales bacterium]|nr:hypothetical protein [Myxococcales bacterium]
MRRSNPRLSLSTGLASGAVLATALGLSLRAPADEKFLRVADLKPGMKGYGLTVFQGAKPERFDVEIIGTLHNFRPRQDLILIKSKHPRIDVARTVAGMSGSPIYIDGKMIGAYAYGWMFNVEPIAGVTPIHDMLADLRRPVPPALAPGAGKAPLPARSTAGAARPAPLAARPAPLMEHAPLLEHARRFAASPLEYDLRAHATQIASLTRRTLAAPQGTSLAPASTDLMVAGLGARSLKLAEELFEPIGLHVLEGGGTGTGTLAPGEPTRFVDGGVITVPMLSGDISMSGLGTVTYVEGDRLVAFGHPMMQGGLESFPTALGRVHWVLATQNRSFKIGEPTQRLGTLVNDRQASIVVDMSRRAPTFPIVVDVEGAPGAPHTHWTMEATEDQFLAPGIAAMGIGSALETAAGERNETTWRATSKLHLRGHGTLTVEDFGAGSQAPIGPGDFARSRLVRAVGAVLNNPWEVGEIERIETKVSLVMRREVMFLRGTKVLDPEVEPGTVARVRLTLASHLGAERSEIIEVPMSKSLAGQTVRVQFRPAYVVDRTVPAPENYSDLVRVLAKMDFPSEAIIASYDLPNEATATFRGKVARRMPPGMADMLRSSGDSVAPELFAAQHQEIFPLQGFVIGDETVEIRVRAVLE